jgi:hypothetical protein
MSQSRNGLADAVGILGWCQCGSSEELPYIKHRREYDKDAPPRPDWRITCFYVDKKHRGRGVARAALEGALDQITLVVGGLVEAISEVTAGREAKPPAGRSSSVSPNAAGTSSIRPTPTPGLPAACAGDDSCRHAQPDLGEVRAMSDAKSGMPAISGLGLPAPFGPSGRWRGSLLRLCWRRLPTLGPGSYGSSGK